MAIEFELIAQNSIDLFRKDVQIFLGLTDKQYNCFLKIINYGKRFYDIEKNYLQDDVIKEISDLCNIETNKLGRIIRLFGSLLKNYNRGDVQLFKNDLIKLGLTKDELLKFETIYNNINDMENILIEYSEEQDLSKAIIPFLEDIDVTLDIRIETENEKIVRSVPVIIVRLETDDHQEPFVFQMDVGLSRYFINTLNTIYKNAFLFLEKKNKLGVLDV